MQGTGIRTTVELPQPFVLVGRGGLNVVDDGGIGAPLVIDGEGVVLRGGAVYAWCRAGCCTDSPRRWPSVDAAADYHGSYIIDAGAVHDDQARRPEDPLDR